MTTFNSPPKAPASSTDPGMVRPVVALLMVFVVGMVCVGLIYTVGEPAGETAIETRVDTTGPVEPSTDKTETATQAPPVKTFAPVEPGRGYVSPGGASPMPKHGEAEVAPIPSTVLIDDAAFDTEPPQASTLPEPDGPVPWDEADKYLERVITVKGTIVDTNNIGDICFLNFDTDWQDKFYIAMFKEAFELLPDPPEEHYLNMTLLVTGKVTLHRDRPQIAVHDVSQIEVVE